jgi:hypothetical protein
MERGGCRWVPLAEEGGVLYIYREELGKGRKIWVMLALGFELVTGGVVYAVRQLNRGNQDKRNSARGKQPFSERCISADLKVMRPSEFNIKKLKR